MPPEPASAPRDFAANSLPLRRASVLLPLPLSGAFDYLVPEELAVTPGDFVIVPLGRRRVVGVVWDRSAEAEGLAEDRLKPIQTILDTPPMAETMRRFVDWVAAYSLTPPGAVLRMAMSVPAAFEEPRAKQALRATGARPPGTKLTEKRRRVLALLEDGRAMAAAALSAEAGVTSAVLRDMASIGLLETLDLPEFQTDPTPDPMQREALDGDQKAAAEDLTARVARQGFSVALLDGVTGSGKTEVYFAAIEAALEAGRQCLVLLPEIALSGQWLMRFRQRFGFAATLWHSDIRLTTRRDTWRRIARGRASVVVGARSALFLPLDHLGLIIVDEEHEASFKQEEGVLYNARDMAVVRGRLAEVPVVLVSATPSLETLNNVAIGRYDRLHLPERHGAAGMPEVTAIDVRRDPPPRGRWITPPLAEAVEQTMARGEQAMLFLNRRGYAPLTLCRQCGYRMQCPNCSAWLVEHRLVRRLVCHHCGHTRPLPKTCPQCQEPDSLVACGPGVERLAEEAAALFPMQGLRSWRATF